MAYMGKKRKLGVFKLLATAAIAAIAAGCSSPATNDTNTVSEEPGTEVSQENVTLTLYSGQHKKVSEELVKAFEEESGIKIELRDGSSNELAHQIVEEGEKSPADLIFTEESSPLVMLKDKGMLAQIDDDATSTILPEYRDADGYWTGVLARSRVVVYDPDLIQESDLPKSVLDLNQDKWQGKFGYVPTSGAFQMQLSAIIKLDGKEAAKDWLLGLKKNGKIYKRNSNALEAVERGEIPFALINNYYWDRQAKEKGIENLKSRLHFFGNQDLGALITISGIAIVKTTKHNEAAQQFIKFATSEQGQQILTDNSSQYPLNPEVETTGMKPFSELEPPNGTLDLGEYSDGKAAIDLLQEVGLL